MASSSDDNTSSLSAILSALILYGVIAIIMVIAFLILRPYNKQIYARRNFSATVPKQSKPRPLASGFIGWLIDLLTRKDSEIIRDAGLDGYFFLRFLRVVFLMLFVGCIILLPILLPVNATGGGGANELDLLAFGNVTDHHRYFAHAFLSWIFFGFVMFLIYRETVMYVGTRQAVLTSPYYKSRPSSRTLLLNQIPPRFLNEEYLISLFEGVKHITFNRNYKAIAKLVEKRDDLLAKVEAAENKIIKKGLKKRLKAEKNNEALKQGLASYVDPPTHRLKFIVGKKVETLAYAKEELPKLNAEIADIETHLDKSDTLNSAFLTFHTQRQAETAFQVLSHHQAFHLSPKFVGVLPDEIVWNNLDIQWWERLGRSLLSSTFQVALCVFWAIPVAFVGFISQINVLIDMFHWLSWIQNLPDVLFGLISSILPTVLLAVLMMLLPIIIRYSVRFAGAPTNTHVEYRTQQVYFLFQVLQVFIIPTLASSIMSALQQIRADPGNILTLLRERLPKASNFFISYILLQGLTIPAGSLLQITSVALYYVFSAVLDNTPRKVFNRRNALAPLGWGTVFPIYSNFVVIILSYSIISPIIMPFGLLCFILMYISFLHNITFIVAPSDGRGIFYARALRHMFVGIYLAEVVLLLLFVFAKAWGPVALEVILLLFTIYFQTHLSSAYNDLIFSLPRSLMRLTDPFQETPLSKPSLPSNIEADEDESCGHTLQGSVSKASHGAVHSVFNDTANLIGEDGRNVDQNAGFFTQFFQPHLYSMPHFLNDTLLSDPVWHANSEPLSAQNEAKLYLHPAFTSGSPVVWFPKDPYGWSEKEVRDLRAHEVNATNKGAWYLVSEKKKLNLRLADDAHDIPTFEFRPDY